MDDLNSQRTPEASGGRPFPGPQAEHGGIAIVLVLAFMALAIPVIASALAFASTTAVDSRVKTDMAKEQYAALGGAQHALYRLANEDGYPASLDPGVPDSYTITLHGTSVPITVEKLANTAGAPSVEDSQLRTYKDVTPATATPGTLTTFTYTITVKNEGTAAEDLKKIYDKLPPDFHYLPGSTGGVTTQDPLVQIQGGIEETESELLTWNIAPLGVTLAPGASVNLTFDAEADVPEDTYCNEAWVKPGGKSTSSGPTAKVTVGSPPYDICAEQAARIAKVVDPSSIPTHSPETLTYTITIENTWTQTLEIKKIIDWLPEHVTYVVGTVSGDITTSEPSTSWPQGHQRLRWNFSSPVPVAPGEVKTLIFQAMADVGSAGFYPNEVWIKLQNFNTWLYTGPTADVEAVDGFLITAGDGGAVSAKVWVDSEQIVTIEEWEFGR